MQRQNSLILIAFVLFSIQITCRLVKLRPLKCQGIITKNPGPTQQEIPAIFLGRDKLEILEPGDSSSSTDVTVCDVIPVPIQSYEYYQYLLTTFKRSKSTERNIQIDKGSCIAAAARFVGRDHGLFDNLPFVWGARGTVRKELYSFLTGYYDFLTYVLA